MDAIKNLTIMQWIGIVLGINGLLTASAPQLTVLFGAAAIPYIQALATLGSGALGVVIAVIGSPTSQLRNVANLVGDDGKPALRVNVNANASPAVAAVALDPAQKNVGAASPDVRAALADTVKAAA